MPFLVLGGVKDFTWQTTYLRLNRKVVKSVYNPPHWIS